MMLAKCVEENGLKLLLRLLAAAALAVSYSVVAGPSPDATLVTSKAALPHSAPTAAPHLAEADRMLLDEYRLADKVEARVLGDMKVYGAVLGLALAFIGFLGFQVIVDALTRRLEKTAKDDLEAIRARTQTALVDLELAVREGQKTSGIAAEQVATLRQRHSELEDLAAKYQTLHAQTQSISQRVERASSAAAESQEKVAGLGVALSNTFAGSPAIFMTSFDWVRGGAIGGKNFGKVPGKLHLSFESRSVSAPGASVSGDRMEPFEVAGEHIKEWTDTSIRFQMPEHAMLAVNAFKADYENLRKTIDPDHRGDWSLSYEFVVERADGVKGKQ